MLSQRDESVGMRRRDTVANSSAPGSPVRTFMAPPLQPSNPVSTTAPVRQVSRFLVSTVSTPTTPTVPSQEESTSQQGMDEGRAKGASADLEEGIFALPSSSGASSVTQHTPENTVTMGSEAQSHLQEKLKQVTSQPSELLMSGNTPVASHPATPHQSQSYDAYMQTLQQKLASISMPGGQPLGPLSPQSTMHANMNPAILLLDQAPALQMQQGMEALVAAVYTQSSQQQQQQQQQQPPPAPPPSAATSQTNLAAQSNSIQSQAKEQKARPAAIGFRDLEQELAKIHGGTRNPPAASNASQPAQSTQPLVILEATSPTPLTEGGEPSLNILSAPPVRKVSRFQVSVVNEGEEVAGAATLGEESTAAGQEDFDSANQEFCGEDQEDRSSPPNFPCEGITRRGRFSVVTHPGDLADAYDMFQLPTDDEDEDRPYDLNQRSPALRHHPSSLYHLPSDYAVKRKTPRPPLKLLPSTGSFYNHHSPVTSPTSTYGMSQFTADDMQRCLYSQSVDEPHDKPRHLQRQRRATENSHWIEPPAFTLSPPHTETGGLLPRAGSVADFRNLQPSSACPSRSTSPLMSPSNASNTLQRWASHSDLSAPVKSSSTRRKLPLRPDQKCTLVRSYSFDPPHLRSTESSTSRRHLSSSDEPRHLLQARLKSARSMINLVQNKQMTHHYPQLHHRKSVYHTVHAGMKPSVWVQQPKSSCSSSLEDLSDEDADDEDDTAAAAARYQQSSRAAQRLMV
ncbi:hypothetical protein B566_EDAN006980 [Ephemera danica]|nr:hypothetical protein B566_EDAN006980 [Ephemera danica]